MTKHLFPFKNSLVSESGPYRFTKDTLCMVADVQKSPQTPPLPPPSITTGCREGGLSLDSRNLLNWGCSAPEGAPSPPAVTLSPAARPSFPSAAHHAPGKVEVGAGTRPPQQRTLQTPHPGRGEVPPTRGARRLHWWRFQRQNPLAVLHPDCSSTN